MILKTLNAIAYGDLITASIIFSASYLIARLIQFLMKKHFSKVTEAAASNLDEKILAVIRKPIYYIVLLLGIYLALLQIRALAEYRSLIENAFL
ncbi:MAG: hypothetical protein QME59_02165, partial [Candidatus Hydrothermarchaeota archaeon]|nr:hypothetical protein [Candidatus Hydrothermarchaeota archaeon]